MSFTPWKEAAFLSNSTKSSGSAVTSNTSSLSPDKNSDKNSKNSTAIVALAENSMTLSVKKKSKENNVDLEAFDKRFILRTMQKQCSVEFLRNHNLAGSEELILKKKNKASILLAYTEWIGGKGTDDGEVVGANAGDSDEIGGGDAMSHICIDQSVSNSDVSGKRLTDTFSVLYSRSGCTRTTVLLLHEDYSNELPVFGQQLNATDISDIPSNNSSISATYKLLKKGNLGAGVAGRDGKGGSESHRIICVMGAVRDASDSEISAAITGECSVVHLVIIRLYVTHSLRSRLFKKETLQYLLYDEHFQILLRQVYLHIFI
jgi:hypothetical protein